MNNDLLDIVDELESINHELNKHWLARTDIKDVEKQTLEEISHRIGSVRAQLILANCVDIDSLIETQYAWLKEVGWDKTDVLQDLALLCSEVGEAVNECRGDEPTPEFAMELADIILRTVGIAGKNGIALSVAIQQKIAINKARGTRGRKV